MTASFAGARSIVLDADSTLCGIEGIDWLATLRPATVADEIARLTREAMDGALKLEDVYGARIEAVAPTRTEVEALAAAYLAAIAPGAAEFVRAMQAADARVVIVSGGLRHALLPLAASIGVHERDVHAVDISFDAVGRYADFDRASPLTRSRGKATCVRAAELARPVVAVGDGSTDLEIRAEGACDAFVAFTGFVRRAEVVAAADAACASFGELHELLRAQR
ncbi:MAG: HAD-IB family phosphatase [Gemmatimonadaceae bacterium]